MDLKPSISDPRWRHCVACRWTPGLVLSLFVLSLIQLGALRHYWSMTNQLFWACKLAQTIWCFKHKMAHITHLLLFWCRYPATYTTGHVPYRWGSVGRNAEDGVALPLSWSITWLNNVIHSLFWVSMERDWPPIFLFADTLWIQYTNGIFNWFRLLLLRSLFTTRPVSTMKECVPAIFKPFLRQGSLRNWLRIRLS